jgi:hypothetical protein
MGELYLSARTEVLRAMNIDTGREVAIIGAPEDLVVWLNKILPIHTRIVSSPDELDSCPCYDILLWWAPDGISKEGLGTLSDHLSENGDLWVIVNREIEITFATITPDELQKRRLVLTPVLDLVPVVLRSIEKDQ